MSNLLEYKGYLGSVEFSDEDNVLHGKLQFIRALVLYEGTDISSLRKAFSEAVDDYLELCEAQGERPELPLKGSFNVRPGRELHRRAINLSIRRQTSLNKVVSDALRNHLNREDSIV